jgi:hypothetical protein
VVNIYIIIAPQVEDGGDGLQIWRIAVNILNKQSRTADKGWSSRLGVGSGANNSSPYKIILLREFTRSFGYGYGCETWSLILRKEHRLWVFENRVLRRIFGPKRDEVTGD